MKNNKNNKNSNKHDDKRIEKLMEIVGNDEMYMPLIINLEFYEKQMDYLRTLPWIIVSPKDENKQIITSAYKMHKEIYQQYCNGFKILQKVVIGEDAEDEMFKWLKDNNEWNG